MEDAQSGCGSPGSATASRVRLQPDLAAVMDTVTHNRLATGKLSQTLERLTSRLDCRLTEERAYADQRFRRYEDLLRQQNETSLQQSSLHLEAIQQLQTQVVQVQQRQQQQQQQQQPPPPAGAGSSLLSGGEAGAEAFIGALASVEAALGRVDAKLASVQAALVRECAAPARPPRLSRGDSAAVPAADGPHRASVEAALARIEAKLALVEAALAREDAAFARPAAAPADAACAALGAPAGGNSPVREAPGSAGGGTLVTQEAPAPAGGGALAQEEVHRPPEGTTFTQLVPALPQDDDQSLAEVVKIRSDFTLTSRRGDKCYDNDTFLGLEYEELHHLHNSGSWMPMPSRCVGAVLRCLRWLQSLEEPERTGCLARIIQSRWFETLSVLAILLNASAMLFAVDGHFARAERGEDTEDGIQVSKLVFLSFFTLEIGLKLMVHRLFFFVGQEAAWNTLDLLVVVTSILDSVVIFLTATVPGVVDTKCLRTLRVIKLVRLIRVQRVLRVFSDLRLLLASVVGSLISLFWSLVMMFVVYYFFGLLFVESMTMFFLERGEGVDPGLKEDIVEHFGSVGVAMLSLYKATTGGNDWDFYFQIIGRTGWWQMRLLFLFFEGFVQIFLMNILAAVFVERAMRLAEPDTAAQARERHRQEIADAEELRQMCRRMDANLSGTVSAEEFRVYLSSLDMQCCFKVLGLDVGNAQEFFDMLCCTSNQEIELEAFVQGCLQMRGNSTRVGQEKIRMETKQLQRELSRRLDGIDERLLQLSRPT